jgi:DNA-binding MarR family transcriptional regulator
MMAVMGDTRWLDAREARAWRRFITMQVQLRARMARQLQRDSGLSEADYEVLVQLSEAPDGRQRVFELGRATQWEKSRLSHHLTRMAQRGLVARETCPTDFRGAFVVLTDAGRAAIEAAAPQHVEHVRRWFIDALTPEQLEALADMSEAVLDRLAGDGEAACAAEECDES